MKVGDIVGVLVGTPVPSMDGKGVGANEVGWWVLGRGVGAIVGYVFIAIQHLYLNLKY
jgi:hypothetical protein